MGAGNWTWVLYQSNKPSSLLSHRSSLSHMFLPWNSYPKSNVLTCEFHGSLTLLTRHQPSLLGVSTLSKWTFTLFCDTPYPGVLQERKLERVTHSDLLSKKPPQREPTLLSYQPLGVPTRDHRPRKPHTHQHLFCPHENTALRAGAFLRPHLTLMS